MEGKAAPALRRQIELRGDRGVGIEVVDHRHAGAEIEVEDRLRGVPVEHHHERAQVDRSLSRPSFVRGLARACVFCFSFNLIGPGRHLELGPWLPEVLGESLTGTETEIDNTATWLEPHRVHS